MLVRIFLSLLCLFLSNESFSLENVKQEPKKELIFELLDPNALYPAFGAVPLCNGKIRLTNKLGAEIKKLEISFIFLVLFHLNRNEHIDHKLHQYLLLHMF